MRRSRAAGLVLCACILSHPLPVTLASEPEYTARSDSGMSLSGSLAVAHGQPVFSMPSGENVSLIEFRRIDIGGREPLLALPGLLRQVELRSGDRISGGLKSLDAKDAVLELRGRREVRIPRPAIRAISGQPGLRDVFYDDGERTSEAIAEQPAVRAIRSDRVGRNHGWVLEQSRWDWPVRELTGNVLISCWFRTDAERMPAETSGIEIHFRSELRQQPLRILLAHDGSIGVGGAAARMLAVQPLPVRTGWRKLTIRAEGRQLQVNVDELQLARGARPDGTIARISLFREGQADAATEQADTAEAGRLVFDDLLVQAIESASEPELAAAGSDQDAVRLFDGTRLFGTIASADASRITIRVASRPLILTWGQVHSLAFAREKQAARSVSGLQARMTLPFGSGSAGQVDRLQGAIRGFDGRAFAFEHAVLGRLRLPLTAVQRIEPDFFGLRIELADGPHHLGDELRPDFRQPAADGRRLDGTFEVAEWPEGNAYFAADVSELEPCGDGTPRGSRFLRELRAGHLLTDLWINDTRVGSLNAAFRTRARTPDSQRIRILVPARLLRSGANRWRLEQQPARTNPASFDDFEIQRIAVEVETGPSED